MTARAAVIVVAGLLAYANGLDGPFVFDDYTAIVQNPTIRRVLPLSASLSPPRDTPVAGRPLVNLSLAVNYAAGGLEPRGYHLANLAIHLLAALALCGVVRRTLELDGLHPGLRERARDLAFVSALIWMLHPLQSEVVNYATQRTTSMKGLALLITLYCSIRALGTRPGRWTAAAVVSCAAGMACKESMVIAPILIVLFDRVFVYGSLREAVTRRRVLYAGLAASWIVLAALMAQAPRTTVGFGGGISAWTYLLNQATVIVDYLRLIAWPRALVLDYGLPQPLTLREVLPQAVAVVLLGAGTVLRNSEYDSRLSLAETVVERRPHGRAYFRFGSLLLDAGRRTEAIEYFHRAKRAEFVGARFALGTEYLVDGDAASGARELSEFLARNPQHINAPAAREMLGRAFLAQGRLADAARELALVLRQQPNHDGAHQAMADVLLAENRVAEALPHLQHTAAARPGDLQALGKLGTALAAIGRLEEAIATFGDAVAVAPNDRRARTMLGRTLAARGRFREAVAEFERLVAIAPDDADARRMLAAARLELARSGS